MDTLTFTLKPDSHIPLYRQLYEWIKTEIQAQRILPGEKLPSKRKLAIHLNISQNTIQTAYYQLVEEGYLTSVEKSGFYVSQIENMVALEDHMERNTSTVKTTHSKVNYVFSHDGIDAESFPFSIWGKLSREVINEFNHEMLAIGDSQGNIELRKSIAKYLYHSRGVHCDAEQIIVSAGIEILIQIFTQMLGQNHIYGIENPGYERLRLLFRSNQAHCHGIKIDDKGMILEEVIKSKANVICITPSHQFPSGVIMPINRRMQLINWANEMPDRYIIEDDYDSEFKYSGKPIPALQGLDRNGKVIYLGAFSKSLAPSIRISYMVLPKQLMKTYTEKLPYLVCPVPAFEQNVLHRFIQNGYFERHLNKMRNIYRKKREILIEEIFKIGGDMEVIGADAGLHLLLKVNNGMTETQLVATALDQGVKVNGISKFYFHENYEGEMGIVLLGFATMEKTKIPEAVQLLKKAWFCSI